MSTSGRAPEPVRPRPVRSSGYGPARLKATLTLGLAFVAVVGVVLGLVIWQDPRGAGQRASADITPRPSASGVTGELDQATRTATLDAASMTFPDDPYVLHPDPMRVDGLFDSYFVAGATVHEDYHDGRDWSAVVGLADVTGSVSQRDLETTGLSVARAIAARFFDDQPTEVAQLSTAEHAVDGCSGLLVTATVRYRIAGLPSHADNLSVLVVRLDDGTIIAGFSSVPTDAPQAVRQQAEAALESVHIG